MGLRDRVEVPEHDHRRTAHNIAVPWYIPEGAEFDSDVEHGYYNGSNVWPGNYAYTGPDAYAVRRTYQTWRGSIRGGTWEDPRGGIRDDDHADLGPYDDEVEDWEVQIPLRHALRPHRGVFEEYDQLFIPIKTLEPEFEAQEDKVSERHTKQNRFAGTPGRMRRFMQRGGASAVSASDTIGVGNCWCHGSLCWVEINDKDQLQIGWPGHDEGAPHPRFSATKTEVRVPTSTTLTRRELRAYPNKVADLILHIVNDCVVRWRDIDGGHLLLYPPDGVSRPFKVSASRRSEQTLLFLNKFIEDYGLEPAPEERKSFTGTNVGEKLAERLAEKVAPPPIEKKEVAMSAAVTEENSGKFKAAEGWTLRYHSVTKEPLNWEEKDGVFRCTICRDKGEDFTVDAMIKAGPHNRFAHADPKRKAESRERSRQGQLRRHARERGEKVETTPEEQPAVAPESPAKAPVAPAAKETVKVPQNAAHNALKVLLKALDYPAVDTDELAKVILERDAALRRAEDAEAKLALMREALGL